jgi:hypothetical protein
LFLNLFVTNLDAGFITLNIIKAVLLDMEKLTKDTSKLKSHLAEIAVIGISFAAITGLTRMYSGPEQFIRYAGKNQQGNYLVHIYSFDRHKNASQAELEFDPDGSLVRALNSRMPINAAIHEKKLEDVIKDSPSDAKLRSIYEQAKTYLQGRE